MAQKMNDRGNVGLLWFAQPGSVRNDDPSINVSAGMKGLENGRWR